MQELEPHIHMLMHVPEIEMLDNLARFEEFYFQQFLSNLLRDPKFKDRTPSRTPGKINIIYLPFADSATLAKLEKKVNAYKKHGQYSIEDYNLITNDVMRSFVDQAFTKPGYAVAVVFWARSLGGKKTGASEFAYLLLNDENLQELTRYKENLIVVLVEPSAPTIVPDRGYGIVRYLAKKYKERTYVVALIRDNKVLPKGLNWRESLHRATPQQLFTLALRAGVLLRGLDLEKMTVEQKRQLIQQLSEQMAPPAAIARSDRELDRNIEDLYQQGHLKSIHEEAFWEYILYKHFGLSPERCLIETNPFSQNDMSLHEQLLNSNNPIRLQINKLRLKTT